MSADAGPPAESGASRDAVRAVERTLAESGASLDAVRAVERTLAESGASLDAVRAVERTLAERADHRTEAERSLVAARAAADAILAHARDQGLAEAAALYAQRLTDAARRASATVADAHTRGEREAGALLRRREELTAELVALVLPGASEAPRDAGAAGS